MLHSRLNCDDVLTIAGKSVEEARDSKILTSNSGGKIMIDLEASR